MLATKSSPRTVPTPAPTMPEAQAVRQEDPHHAPARGAERLQNADVARLLDDDHEEDRQDAEARDGDDHEQQHVEDRPFPSARRRAAAPCLSRQVLTLIELRRETRPAILSRIAFGVGARLQLDLNRRELADAGRRDRSCRASLCSFSQRHEGEVRVVLAHLAFVEIDDGAILADDLRRRHRERES